MNCFNHPNEVAVASCVDCGKGLCKPCAGLYQMPICNECNLRRVKNDRGNIIKVYLPSIIFFIIGFVLGLLNISFRMGIALGYVFAGIPWGWKLITFIQPKIFLFLSFFGWVVYFVIKLTISLGVGMYALPIGIAKLIIGLVSVQKKEQIILNNFAHP